MSDRAVSASSGLTKIDLLRARSIESDCVALATNQRVILGSTIHAAIRGGIGSRSFVERAVALVACAVTALAVSCAASQHEGTIPLLAVKDVEFGRTYALVIGNQTYQALDALRTATNDAKDVSVVLRSQYGYTVRLLNDATREQIFGALADLRQETADGDNAFVYYAGHGFLDESTNTGYWLPIDASPNNRANWISNFDITEFFRGMAARHVIVVADSCYSGSLLRSIPTDISSGFVRKLVEKRARVVITSGGREPVADGGGDGHSVFARAFLLALSQNDGVLDGARLFGEVRQLVTDNADQTPEYGVIANSGHEGGDFLFFKAGSVTVSAPVRAKEPAGSTSNSAPAETSSSTDEPRAIHKVYTEFNDRLNNGMPPEQALQLREYFTRKWLKLAGQGLPELKSNLQKLQFYTGALDDKFGPDLVAAVQAFQRANNLAPADGICGVDCLSEIASLLRRPNNVGPPPQ